MSTPESKVKQKVKKILDSYGAYHFSPQTGGYGRSGIPDIIACYKGSFIAIECKANGNKPTMLQQREINKIQESQGHAYVIDENNINTVNDILSSLGHAQLSQKETYADINNRF